MGPFSLEEVNRQLAAGTLHLSDQAWYEGAAGWASLSTVPGVSRGSPVGRSPPNPLAQRLRACRQLRAPPLEVP